jgi:hypothetical protein
MKQNYTKGEVVNVNLGVPPNEVKGHEQGSNCKKIKIVFLKSLKKKSVFWKLKSFRNDV